MACIFHWHLNCNNNNTNNLITVIMMMMMMMMMMTLPTNKHFPTSTGGSIWHQEDNLTLLSWRWSREGRNFHSAISHWAFSKLDKMSTSKLEAKINCLTEKKNNQSFNDFDTTTGRVLSTEAAPSFLICIILHNYHTQHFLHTYWSQAMVYQ